MSWFSRLAKFDPDQPRDNDGRWTSSGITSRTGSHLLDKLHSDGGFTYQPVTGDAPKPGDKAYAVAYSKDTERVFPLASLSVKDVQGFVKENWSDLKKSDHYFGGWVDDGKAYLDCSIVKRDEAEAIKTAQENNQLAYFDFGGMRTVNTPDRTTKADDHAGKVKPPQKVHLASPTPEGVIKLYEALTGKTATPEEVAEVTREFAHLPK